MELTTKGRYAVTAMADIASHAGAAHAGAPAVPLSQVAERQNLPLAYLEQIFVSLRRAGLVESARGRSGGYRLTRPATEISVGSVMEAVDEETRFTRCSDDNPRCSLDTPCLTHGLWTALGQVTSDFFRSVSLADVIASAPARPEPKKTAKRSAPEELARVYLDYNATAPLRPEARAAMLAALDVVGNPSSVHADGRKVRGIVEEAREKVARLVGAKPSEVVFTSGASEANAWVMAQPWRRIFVSNIEHDSVLAGARANSAELIDISTDRRGVVDMARLAERIAANPEAGQGVIALQFANNETGIVQPVAEVAALAREHHLFMHCDAVQAAGRLPIDFAALGVQTLSLSAHKLGGPKGVGALVIRDHVDLVPLLRGGGQERRRRAGTENVAAIAAFGAAAEAAQKDIAAAARIATLRDELEAAVHEATPDALIIGSDAQRLANTSAIALPGKLAETLVIRLDLAGIAVSAGSACSSGKVGASHVLEAMGLPREIAASAIRVSLGNETTKEDIAAFAKAWRSIAGVPAIAA